MIQDVIAILIVAISAGFLVHRGWQQLTNRRKSACGSCANCGGRESLQSKPIVSITPIMSRVKTPKREEVGS